MKVEYKVTHNSIVKEYLNELGLSKKFCKRVKLYGKILINGIEAKNYYPVNEGDIITLEYNEQKNNNIISKDVHLNIIYETDHLLIVNKPPFLASQPSRKHFVDNVISYVKNYFNKNNINSNVHLVNRLDYQTSGLMIIAKDGYTHHLMSDSILTKKYIALVEGEIKPKEGKIDLPIARKNIIDHVLENNDNLENNNDSKSILREVNDNGKPAITLYKTIKQSKDYSLVDIELLTGRTHQIRVHFSHLGHPLVGDKLYNPKYSLDSNKNKDERLYLHSYFVSFTDPFTKERIEIIDKSLNPINTSEFENKYFD